MAASVGIEDYLDTEASGGGLVKGGKGDGTGLFVHHTAGIGGGDGLVGAVYHRAIIGGAVHHSAGTGGGDCIIWNVPRSAMLPLLGGGHHHAPSRAGGAET